ncbi:MAG: 2OG-Fe(II) oxygenase [Kangiella sp.]|nr:MAG: 2OG-Fe(II) oxygenase [Kangiella sp.]
MNVEDYIKIYDNALSDKVCDSLVGFFENNSKDQKVNGQSAYEHLPGSQWKELNLVNYMSEQGHQEFVDILLKYKAIYENDAKVIPNLPYSGKLADLRIKKYEANGKDRFLAHFDAAEDMSNRYMVFLWYLNDVDVGGETVFVDLGVSVNPKKGRLLIFPPYWMYRHEGKVPVSNSKYVINTFLLW